MGDAKKITRKRATGTRENVVTYLAQSGELYDKDGMASTRLAAAVGYPGSSVAFAQLLSGMERSGLIKREVRGKRTYRISLEDVNGIGPAPRTRSLRGGVPAIAGAGSGTPDGEFDYDELARRLLIQVVRRLAAAEPESDLRQPADSPGPLDETVADLEHELASAWTKHGRLAEENIRLREQLRSAQESLAMARERVRKLPITSDLDNAEVVLLQRLLTPDTEEPETRDHRAGRAGRGRGRGRGIIAGRLPFSAAVFRCCARRMAGQRERVHQTGTFRLPCRVAEDLGYFCPDSRAEVSTMIQQAPPRPLCGRHPPGGPASRLLNRYGLPGVLIPRETLFAEPTAQTGICWCSLGERLLYALRRSTAWHLLPRRGAGA